MAKLKKVDIGPIFDKAISPDGYSIYMEYKENDNEDYQIIIKDENKNIIFDKISNINNLTYNVNPIIQNIGIFLKNNWKKI